MCLSVESSQSTTHENTTTTATTNTMCTHHNDMFLKARFTRPTKTCSVLDSIVPISLIASHYAYLVCCPTLPPDFATTRKTHTVARPPKTRIPPVTTVYVCIAQCAWLLPPKEHRNTSHPLNKKIITIIADGRIFSRSTTQLVLFYLFSAFVV